MIAATAPGALFIDIKGVERRDEEEEEEAVCCVAAREEEGNDTREGILRCSLSGVFVFFSPIVVSRCF